MRTLVFVILTLFYIGLRAQTNNEIILSQRTIFAEFWGASHPFGINYDSRFHENSRWGYRLGIAYMKNWKEFNLYGGLDIERISGMNIPMEINYLIGRKGTKNKLELGAGLNLGFYNEEIGYQEDWDIDNEVITDSRFMVGYFMFANIGYRLQPRNGFLFRVGVIPIFDFGWKGSIANYVNVSMFIPYLGFGYAF